MERANSRPLLMQQVGRQIMSIPDMSFGGRCVANAVSKTIIDITNDRSFRSQHDGGRNLRPLAD